MILPKKYGDPKKAKQLLDLYNSPGRKLSIPELCQMFGISKTSL